MGDSNRKPVVVCGGPEEKFVKYGVRWPDGWEIRYVHRTYEEASLKDADYLFVDSMDVITGEIMDMAPRLKVIHTEGVSFDRVDVDAADERGILVCNNRAVNKVSVAEHCIALALAGVKKITLLDDKIKNDGYVAANEIFQELGVREVAGMKIGMIGMGAIGREVLKRWQGWDCDLYYYDPIRMPEEAEKEYGVTYLELNELFRMADIVTVHVPVVPSTVGIVGWDQIKLMKKNSVLVNVSRGAMVVDEAVIWALENDRIGCAALDTVEPEPMPDDHPYLRMSDHARRRLILTTHSAGKTEEAFRRILQWTVNDFVMTENGELPDHIVNNVKSIRL